MANLTDEVIEYIQASVQLQQDAADCPNICTCDPKSMCLYYSGERLLLAIKRLDHLVKRNENAKA